MFKDIISYELDEAVDEIHLLEIANVVVDTWMNKQPGFIKWEIHKDTIGDGYTDIVYWKSREAAETAEKHMVHIPNAADWFCCYKEGTVKSQNLEQIGSLK